MGNNRTNVADFSGSTVQFGIDVHKKSWVVTTRLGEVEQKTLPFVPQPVKLKEYLERTFPGAALEGVYEAGFCGFWIVRSFQEIGIEMKVVHPADVPTTDKERDRKDDSRDSRKLARGLFNQSLNSIYVPSTQQESDRELIRCRGSLVEQQTVIKNQIKSLLMRHNREPDFEVTSWTIKYKRWLESLNFGEAGTNEVLKLYLRRLGQIHKEILYINKQIRILAQSPSYINEMTLLRTIPSISILSGMTILTELGDTGRFKTEDELCSYAGLAPSSHSSGENIQVGNLSRRGNRWLRHILIECAWMAIRLDPALGLAYQKMKQRMVGQKAIVRIAKKLLKRIRFVLQNRKPYQTGLA